MANIRVDINYPIQDGSEIVFRSPVDCTAITGLIVYYQAEDGNTTSKEFALADAHGNNVGDIPHLFAENVVIKVILDVTSGMAFVQNADTNAYLERKFRELATGGGGSGVGIHIGTEAPTDENVKVWIDTDEEDSSGGSGGVSSWNDLTDRPFYSEYEIGTVLDETSHVFGGPDDIVFMMTEPVSVFTGEEYIVIWNGTEYTCVCGEFDMEGVTFQSLGNLGAMGIGDDTGEPFHVTVIPVDMVETVGATAQIIPLDGSTELTISITGTVETVIPLPAKYLPKPVFLYTDGTYLYKTPDTTDANNMLIKTELASLIESGRTIYVCHNNDDTIGYFVPVDIIIRSDGGTISVINTTGAITRTVLAAPNARDI
jgi:hypothetical protein